MKTSTVFVLLLSSVKLSTLGLLCDGEVEQLSVHTGVGREGPEVVDQVVHHVQHWRRNVVEWYSGVTTASRPVQLKHEADQSRLNWIVNSSNKRHEIFIDLPPPQNLTQTSHVSITGNYYLGPLSVQLVGPIFSARLCNYALLIIVVSW